MTMGSNQPLVKMSTRNISLGVKVAGAWGWQPHRLHVPNVIKSGSLNLLEPSGPHRAWNGTALHFYYYYYYYYSFPHKRIFPNTCLPTCYVQDISLTLTLLS